MAGGIKYWGVLLKNGEIMVKAFFDDGDIRVAKKSEKVSRLFLPFEADDAAQAKQIIEEMITKPETEEEKKSGWR